MKRIILLMMLMLFLIIPISQAQTVSISLSNYQPLNPMCIDNFVLGATIDVTVDGVGTASYTSIKTYYMGTMIGDVVENYPGGRSLPYTTNNLWITRGFGYGTLPDNTIITVVVSVDVGGTIYGTTFTLNCTTLVANFPSTASSAMIVAGELMSNITYPPDDRINWQFGDTNVGILYAGTDGALDLYDYESDSYIFNFVTEALLEDFVDNPPSQNQLIAQFGRISVYILDTGQIQFNFGPDEEGKIWAFIMNDLYDYEAEDSYYLDPNE